MTLERKAMYRSKGSCSGYLLKTRLSFNCATFRLSCIGSLRCPFKKTLIEKRKKFLDGLRKKGRNS